MVKAILEQEGKEKHEFEAKFIATVGIGPRIGKQVDLSISMIGEISEPFLPDVPSILAIANMDIIRNLTKDGPVRAGLMQVFKFEVDKYVDQYISSHKEDFEQILKCGEEDSPTDNNQEGGAWQEYGDDK